MPDTEVIFNNTEDSSTTNCGVKGEVMIPERQWEEFTFDVPWGIVAGKWYGDRNLQPLIALHGWQDNSGTFDRLVPLLPKTIPVLCIDFPGHGKSSHFPAGMQYYIYWDYIPVIRRICEHYGWEKVKLMGHSLGAAVCFMYAASFPDDVSQYITIDSYGPKVHNAEKIAAMTGSCIDKMLEYETTTPSKLSCYSYDEMIDIAMDAYDGSIDREGAKILMIRGMTQASKDHLEHGYLFSRDVRLKMSVLGLFTMEQVLSYAELIKCAILNIKAIPGTDHERDDIYPTVIEALKKNANVEYYEVPGTHHLHLTTPERIAGIINEFLLDPEINFDY